MLKDKSILAIIPARGGSKGIFKKNIKNLNGTPLIGYTIIAAKDSKYIDRVIVSTDDEEIVEISKECGAEIPFIRPKELANDCSKTVDVVLHTLQQLRINENYKPDYVCLLQCTSPLRAAHHIDECIHLLNKENIDGVISVCKAEVNPYWTNILVGDTLRYFINQGKNITRRQDLPDIYRINGAIYIIKTNTLLKEKTFETENITAYVMDEENSIDIDNIVDFKLAELIFKERDNNYA